MLKLVIYISCCALCCSLETIAFLVVKKPASKRNANLELDCFYSVVSTVPFCGCFCIKSTSIFFNFIGYPRIAAKKGKMVRNREFL